MAAFWRFLISLAYGSLATLAHLARIGRILPGCHISLQRFSDPGTVLITIAHRSGLLMFRAGSIRIAHRSGLLMFRPELISIAYLIRDGDVSTRIDQDCLSDKERQWIRLGTITIAYLIKNADVSAGINQYRLSIRNANGSGWIDKLSLWYRRTTVQTYYSTGVLQYRCTIS